MKIFSFLNWNRIWFGLIVILSCENDFLNCIFCFLVHSPVELSLLYIGMQVQHHYRLLFLVGVLVGRYEYE
jgi:hypothetical protein